jgi:hypothetical protein
VVEGTPLLREHLGKTWIGSSNLLVSAKYLYKSRAYSHFFIFIPSFIPKLL